MLIVNLSKMVTLRAYSNFFSVTQIGKVTIGRRTRINGLYLGGLPFSGNKNASMLDTSGVKNRLWSLINVSLIIRLRVNV